MADERIVLDADHEAWERARAKRTEAVSTVVLGVLMLFMSGFHWGVGAGGVLMVVWGGIQYARVARLARREDPWDDADIDAWEDDEMGS